MHGQFRPLARCDGASAWRPDITWPTGPGALLRRHGLKSYAYGREYSVEASTKIAEGRGDPVSGGDPLGLVGRVALVMTGGAGTIGAAIARAYAAHGARVVVADRVGDRVQKVVAEVAAAGGEAVGHIGDLTVSDQM